jgi:aminoglycoside phosphotransferase (APT) family kinase protein
VPLAELAAAVSDDVDAVVVRTVSHQAVSAPPWEGLAPWLHADMHPANNVRVDGNLADTCAGDDAAQGVIDFGELCAGDPATDIASAWMPLPAGARPRFLEAYVASGAR